MLEPPLVCSRTLDRSRLLLVLASTFPFRFLSSHPRRSASAMQSRNGLIVLIFGLDTKLSRD